MADVSGGNAPALEELALEGEDTEKARDCRAHGSDAARSPSPCLRCNEIDHRDALAVQMSGQAKVKVGRVGQDGNLRLLFWNRADQLAELAEDARNVTQNLDQADHGDGAHIDDGTDAGGLHAG